MEGEKSESGDAKKTMPQGVADNKIPQEASEKSMPQGTAFSESDLKKCLEQNKGDATKCKSMAEALKSSSPRRKPLTPLRLRSGSLTDV